MMIDAIATLLIVMVLAVFLYGPWQWVCSDYARQIVFEKRDAIFDLARRGELDFDSPEYRTIRISLERLIRFSHDVTLPRALFFWLCLIRRDSDEPAEIFKAISRIRDENARKKVTALVNEASLTVVLMLVVKSPMTLLLLIAFVPVTVIVALVLALVKATRHWLHRAVASASCVIQLEAELAAS